MFLAFLVQARSRGPNILPVDRGRRAYVQQADRWVMFARPDVKRSLPDTKPVRASVFAS